MDRLLCCFPHSIANNKRWPADTSSGLLQKMRAEDASSAFLLWICSASHADFTAIEPGKCDMAGPHLLWVWPHARRWALTLCLEQRLHSDPARCWRLLRCHMQTSRVLWWGTWKPLQDSRVLFLVNLLSPRLAHQTKVLTACCWTSGADECFGSGQSGWGAYLESGSVWLEHTCSSWEPQSGCSLSGTYTNHPHLAHLLPQAAI